MRNDGASSSHRGRGVDEWRPENNRYDQSPSKDSYRRGGRDDYGPRDTDPYGRDYPSNRQYPDPYDDDARPTTSYMDPSGRSPPGYDDRDLGWSRWTPKDNRQNHRGRGNLDFNDRHKDGGRKEENSQFKERRRDNGWASRRRNNAETTTNANAIPLGGGELPSNDDRNAEPSSSWQPTHNGRGEGQRKKHKKKKKNQNDKRNNRDWRNDDGHLNKCVLFPYFCSSFVDLPQLAETGRRWGAQQEPATDAQAPATLAIKVKVKISSRFILFEKVLSRTFSFQVC
ncbi:uncharacterized protein PHACADRAFT_250065 [Phanerochaete carnosa HHB-10118-sp]|uniref:Uncharacterized protein n=1 Tax=Phanerochaete carnosa (strain HHB-10118-sp) TaxID=650164 RepID=K5V9J9_PHACS|nr:uncharacterized protein PHACADRAFT_250065 [Phanerochaete carnosa HHB-10118-sp]EKM59511.1 hypothetical protein PHACADRAFT_250065 [Phanerochaete carnosa HHB-10118-sp]